MSAFPPALPSLLPRRHPAACRRGFTLIELLVVIVIIAVLASIALPILQKVQAKGDQTKCASQLKQIGVAIMAYTQDNNQTLPGPLYGGQSAYFNNDKGYGTMMTWLSPYMGFSNVGNKMLRADVFICPSFKKQIPVNDVNPRPYCTTQGVIEGNRNRVRFFGYPGSNPSDPNAAVPFKLNMISDYSKASIMADLDGQLNPASYANKPTICPNTPIHGATRNWLFLDTHVEVSSKDLFALDY